MSNHTSAILKDYLNEFNLLDFKKLGGATKADLKTPTQATNEKLSNRLRQQAKINNTIILIGVAMLFTLFAIGIFLIFKYQDDVKTIGVIFGGTFLSLLSIVGWLRKLWLDKNLLDLSAGIIDGLTPPEAAKYVETMYLSMTKIKESA